MDKIKILLIDDNPFCKAKEPMGNSTTKELIQKFLNIDSETVEQMDEFGFPILNVDATGKNEGFLDFFELKWLYSTSSLKTYFNITNSVEDIFGSAVLGKFGYVPDIVVFDYALTGNESNQPMGYKYEFVKRKLDPIYNLIKLVNKKKIDYKPTSANYEWDKDKGNKDRFGLFVGGVLVERFRHDTPCFGIPATYWETTKLENSEPGFFEWFLEDAFRNVFKNPELKGKTEEKKSWQIIIDAAMQEYRNSIVDLIKLNKIHIDLHELIQLLNGDFLVVNGNRELTTFTFNTIYGLRQLNLDGLFVDVSIETATVISGEFKKIAGNKLITERDIAIWKFLNDVIKAVTELANIGLGIKEIVRAKEIADTLWTEYLSQFENRIDLSEYTCRSGSLDVREKAKLVKLNTDFLVSGGKISSEKEISILDYKGKDIPNTIRLAILYLATNASLKLSRLSHKSNKKSQYRELDEQEIYYLLNPIVNTQKKDGIKLPMHFENFSKIRAVLDTFSKGITEHLEDTIPKPERSSFFDFGTWIKPGEKIILKSFFNEEEHLLPTWLK